MHNLWSCQGAWVFYRVILDGPDAMAVFAVFGRR
jgi:hypothetical protein